jgi:hypothetical protein
MSVCVLKCLVCQICILNYFLNGISLRKLQDQNRSLSHLCGKQEFIWETDNDIWRTFAREAARKFIIYVTFFISKTDSSNYNFLFYEADIYFCWRSCFFPPKCLIKIIFLDRFSIISSKRKFGENITLSLISLGIISKQNMNQFLSLIWNMAGSACFLFLLKLFRGGR